MWFARLQFPCIYPFLAENAVATGLLTTIRSHTHKRAVQTFILFYETWLYKKFGPQKHLTVTIPSKQRRKINPK